MVVGAGLTHSLTAEEIHDLRLLMPALKQLASNKQRIEEILGTLIDDRADNRRRLADLVGEYDKFGETIGRIDNILPTLEHLIENRERIEWFWKTSRQYGAATVGLIILISTFEESVVKLWVWVKMTWFVKP